MKTLILAALTSTIIMGSAMAKTHACAQDARTQAAALLKLHMDGTDMAASIDDKVTVRPSIKALKGKGKFDVLEMIGYVYKAQYRIRMIYAVMTDKTCLLMGQEILEIADPY